MSQIRPHFLYNSLTAIMKLCDDNARAKKAIVDFSEYLRNNVDFINNEKMIPAKKELDHVRCYLSLEKEIYGDALKVVYDIETDDFMLPPLTIQPIAENAVKHGIGKKEGGGTVKISVRCGSGEYVITVTDDGVGYTEGAEQSDDRRHVGLDNVRLRLKKQCGGSLNISGINGGGTVAVVYIPLGS
jgi:sensor histidine kinase YesM